MVVLDYVLGVYLIICFYWFIIWLLLDDENVYIIFVGCVIIVYFYRYIIIFWVILIIVVVVGYMDGNFLVKVELVGVYFVVSGFLCFMVLYFVSVDIDFYWVCEIGV